MLTTPRDEETQNTQNMKRRARNESWRRGSPRSDELSDEGEGKGRWTREEHDRFMHAVTMYPSGPWKQIGAIFKTRSIRQIQTHAQKLREKVARHERGLKIKIKDQLALSVPPSLLKQRKQNTNQVEDDDSSDDDIEIRRSDIPSLDSCLDYLIDLMGTETSDQPPPELTSFYV